MNKYCDVPVLVMGLLVLIISLGSMFAIAFSEKHYNEFTMPFLLSLVGALIGILMMDLSEKKVSSPT